MSLTPINNATHYMDYMKKKIVFLLSIFIIVIISIIIFFTYKKPHDTEIKVGILHSLSGDLAISEKEVADATLFAIEEINNQGGLLGKLIKPILVDGKSDSQVFALQSEQLIKNHKVAAIFGCWTSASRKTVKPIIERHNHILFYPVQYEGLEESKNIIYTGATPNQQIIPGVSWCLEKLGKRIFFVGSDYVFPRVAHEIIKELVVSKQGELVGHAYIPLGSDDVSSIIENIIASKPNVIVNTINGNSNIAFFKALRNAGITPEKIPTMSFSIAEPELKHLDISNMIGDYATWSYFQNTTSKTNELFVQKFKKRYGSDRVISDPMEAAYFGVHIWAQAVAAAQTTNPQEILTTLAWRSFNAPEGIVSIDGKNNHTWKMVRIGKIQQTGQFIIIWDSDKTVYPQPYPLYRTKDEWNTFLTNLYIKWEKRWAPPAEKKITS